ncbi:MAG: hypothetical protein J6X55_13635 [Victivallales bacterium]|nr:hypothetical protein [Victivallales bacterium]
MKSVVAEKKLTSGEQARVVLIVPPEEDGLRGMYEVSAEWKHYYNRAMIEGHDQFIEDRVFIAEVDGVPVARLWYGWSKRTLRGNFGNIFTNYAHRKRGLLNFLLECFKADFDASPAQMLCCHASGWRIPVYEKFGLRVLHGNKENDAMGIVKPELGSCKLLMNRLYADCTVASLRDGDCGDQFDCDKCLVYTDAMWRCSRSFVFAGDQNSDYMTSLNRVLEKKGVIAVAENEAGAIVGYAAAIVNPSWTAAFLNWRYHPNVNRRDVVELLKFTLGKYKASFQLPLYAVLPLNAGEAVAEALEAGLSRKTELDGMVFLG